MILFSLNSFLKLSEIEQKVKTHVLKESSYARKRIHSDTPALPKYRSLLAQGHLPRKLFGHLCLYPWLKSCTCTHSQAAVKMERNALF